MAAEAQLQQSTLAKQPLSPRFARHSDVCATPTDPEHTIAVPDVTLGPAWLTSRGQLIKVR
jgi:hypothetical protein